MARKAREIAYSGNYHVVLRGNDRLLFIEDGDYRKFIDILSHVFTRDFAVISAYYLDDEAVHLVVKEGLGGISKPIKELCAGYAQYFNSKYKHSGKLFYDRFSSEPLETDDDFLDCVRYVHRQAVERKGDISYKYSSYSNYIRRNGIFSEEVMLLLNNSPLKYRVYMDEIPYGNYLSDKPKKVLDTKELASAIRRELSHYSSEEVANMNKQQLKEVVKKIKAIEGASIRKIAQVTGLSKSFVEKC